MSRTKKHYVNPKEVISVFTDVIKNHHSKLAKGAAMRDEIVKAIDEGREPTGYRAEWIKSSAARMIKNLEQIGKEFNEAHPDDRCSLQDLVDVASSTLAWLKRRGTNTD